MRGAPSTQPPLDATALAEAREWLARASEDLQVAELTRSASPALLGSSAYHSQQAAEKALEAFLTARQSPFHLTHDLVELQGQCRGVDASFDAFGRLRRSRRTRRSSATRADRWLHQPRMLTRHSHSRRMSSTSFAPGWNLDEYCWRCTATRCSIHGLCLPARDLTETREAHARTLFGCYRALEDAAGLDRAFENLSARTQR